MTLSVVHTSKRMRTTAHTLSATQKLATENTARVLRAALIYIMLWESLVSLGPTHRNALMQSLRGGIHTTTRFVLS